MSSGEIIIQTTNLSYRPLGAEEYVLKDINLEIYKGEFVLLLGGSGSGKSTLTRCFNGLIPHLDSGEMKGNVITAGKDTRENPIDELAASLGMVFQNPDDQILSLRVVDEVAWGVENLGLPHEEIVSRVDRFLHLLGIEYLKDKLTFAISGGQKQKVSIASNLAMLQDVLVLDDPTTDLDPICKSEVVQTLAYLHREMGKTLIVIEHDLNDLIELANRVIVMDKGQVVFNGSPDKVFSNNYDQLLNMGINIPQHLEIAQAVLGDENSKNSVTLPIQKKQAFALLDQFCTGEKDNNKSENNISKTNSMEHLQDPTVRVRDLEYSYTSGVKILKGINLDVFPGEIVAIVGANGSGKSTFVNNLVGLLHPDKGFVEISGQNTRTVKVDELGKRIGYVFQNPDNQLFKNTVAEEVGVSLTFSQITPEETNKRINDVLDIVGLSGLQARHPFSLSRGQRQKLAVATALIHKPNTILLDEPTTGQDRRTLFGLMDLLSKLNQEGKTIIMVTHDMELVAAYATRMLVMIDGKIVIDGTPKEVFYNYFDTLTEMQLKPPTTIDFCRRLLHKGIERYMTVEDLCLWIEQKKSDRHSRVPFPVNQLNRHSN